MKYVNCANYAITKYSKKILWLLEFTVKIMKLENKKSYDVNGIDNIYNIYYILQKEYEV